MARKNGGKIVDGQAGCPAMLLLRGLLLAAGLSSIVGSVRVVAVGEDAVVAAVSSAGPDRYAEDVPSADFGSVYAREADAFLAERDAAIQPRQIDAILKATAGDGASLRSVRSARNTMAALPAGVVAEMVTPRMRLYRPKGGGDDLPLLVYLHGGGWVIGSIVSCSAFCGELAARRVAVLALDYPLAPEQPYPAALDFVVAVYKGVLSDPSRYGCDARRIAIGGDSSGGNLALATALRLQADGLKPASLVLYYPVAKARADGSASWRRFAVGCGMDAAFMDACNAAYLQGRDWRDPFVSPACATDGQLRELPPLHVLAADRDVLRDQGKAFADRLKALGGIVRYENLSGSTHLFVTVPGQPAAFHRAVDFAAEAMGRSGPASQP